MDISTTPLVLQYNKKKFESKNGLYDLLYSEVEDDTIYDIGYFTGERIEFSFTHTNNYGETYFSFVNGSTPPTGEPIRARFARGC